ncbi:MAG: hypothetical protein HY833_03685 [Candidatus Aenigmarchaeota archaeon]|nr:hypothetical protein [Candidatus Aenigmarchaeota archaeon]
MGIFKKNQPPGKSGSLEEAVEGARSMMSSYGHIGYGSRRALGAWNDFMGYLRDIHSMGGCDEISKMLGEARKDRSYFYDKLNWFHKEYCSGQLGR